MMRETVLLVVLLSAASAYFNEGLNEEWVGFKTTYSKQYGEDEEPIRRMIWEKNVQFIQKHNLEADRGAHTYWVGVNEYADMSIEEFRVRMNGYRGYEKVGQPRRNPVFQPKYNVSDLPTDVDWRPKGYVTPIKNQEQCGSCWAFSTTGSLEGQHFKKTGKLVSLSEQNLVDCSTAEGNHGCKGGLMDKAFTYIKKNNGIDTEKSYPYHAKNMECEFKASDVGATVTGYVDVKQGSEPDLQQAVATVGPISVAIDASHEGFQLYRDGVYKQEGCSQTKLDHGVLVVGYGHKLFGGDYWIVKNSWGTGWGMDGYIEMKRNDGNMCGIASEASYPTV